MIKKIIAMNAITFGRLDLQESLSWSTSFPFSIDMHFNRVRGLLEKLLKDNLEQGKFVNIDDANNDLAPGFKIYVTRPVNSQKAQLRVERFDDKTLSIKIPTIFSATAVDGYGPFNPSTTCDLEFDVKISVDPNITVGITFEFKSEPTVQFLIERNVRSQVDAGIRKALENQGNAIRDLIYSHIRPERPAGFFVDHPDLMGIRLNAALQSISVVDVNVGKHNLTVQAKVEGQFSGESHPGVSAISSLPAQLTQHDIAHSLTFSGIQRLAEETIRMIWPKGHFIWADEREHPVKDYIVHVDRQDEMLHGRNIRKRPLISKYDDQTVRVTVPAHFFTRLTGWRFRNKEADFNFDVHVDITMGQPLQVKVSYEFSRDVKKKFKKWKIKDEIDKAIKEKFEHFGREAKAKLMSKLIPPSYAEPSLINGFNLAPGVQGFHVIGFQVKDSEILGKYRATSQENTVESLFAKRLAQPHFLPVHDFMPQLFISYAKIAELIQHTTGTTLQINPYTTFEIHSLVALPPAEHELPMIEVKGKIISSSGPLYYLGEPSTGDITIQGRANYDQDTHTFYLSDISIQKENCDRVLGAYLSICERQVKQSVFEKTKKHETKIIGPLLKQIANQPINIDDTFTGNINLNPEAIHIGDVIFDTDTVILGLNINGNGPLFNVSSKTSR